MKKTVSGIMFLMLLMGTLTLASNIQPVKAEPTPIISAVEPAQPKAKPSKQWLSILGSDFMQESKVNLSISSSEYRIPSERTGYINPNKIYVLVGLTEPGIWEVLVENPGDFKSNVFSFTVKTAATDAVIDEGLLNLIDQYAGDYFKEETWKVTLDQYKAWIATITWGEGNLGGYVAHSQAPGSDMFYHKEYEEIGYNFRFSTGIGPFQIDRGGEPDNWHKWPTIKKLDPEEALNTTLKWHNRTFYWWADATLKDFSEKSVWYAVKSNYDHPTRGWVGEEDVEVRWKQVTGTKWDDHKNGKNEDLKWDETKEDIKTNYPSHEENIQEIKNVKWDVTFTTETGEHSFKSYHETWLINARGPNGIKLFDYYYAYDDSMGCEVWVWNNAGKEDEFRYIFVRNYTLPNLVVEGKEFLLAQFPLHRNGRYAGVKLDSPALFLLRNVDVVLVIDRSGSMSGTKIADAKWAAKQFVDLMQIGDRVGVVSFASTVRVDYSLSEIVSTDTKVDIKSKIDLIYASGNTAMGDGLRTALDQLVNYGDPSHPWAIVLLSNGWHNWGVEHPYDVTPDLKSNNIRVYTIGLGPSVDSTLLTNIATETGGFYRYAATSFDLLAIYNDIAARITLAQIITSIIGFVTQAVSRIFETFIDSSVTQVTFTVGWGGSDLDLTLIRPDGTLIDPSVAAIDPNIEYIEEARYEIYRIINPMAGTWQMNVTGVDVPPEGESFVVQVTARTSVILSLATDKDSYTYPEPVKIMVTLQDTGIPLIGVDVEAIVTRPDTSQINLTLFDDGLDVHGDTSVNDGAYTNYFSQFNEDGSYTIKVVAIGTTLIGESFSREDQKTVLVSGVPPPPPEYTLTIYSSPSGVTFTVDGVSPTTPWSGTYVEGASVDLVMPENHNVGEARYYWSQWSDEVTSRSRTVTMDSDVTLTAYFTGPYYELTVTSSPITGIPFTINGVPQTTPYTEWLLEGSYTLVMPETHEGYEWSHWLEDGDTERTKTIYLQGTTWTGVYKAKVPVGGVWVPINKFELLAPWIGLASLMIVSAASIVYVKHRKKQQN